MITIPRDQAVTDHRNGLHDVARPHGCPMCEMSFQHTGPAGYPLPGDVIPCPECSTSMMEVTSMHTPDGSRHYIHNLPQPGQQVCSAKGWYYRVLTSHHDYVTGLVTTEHGWERIP